MKGLSTFSVWPGRAFRPGWVINGAALDLNFARGRYWSAGTGATGDLTKLAGYSFNRTGVAWAQEEIGGSGSDIIEYAENVAQTPIGRGYVAEESRTSLAPDSDDLTQWTENGSITVADAGDDIGAGVSWATLTYGYTGTGGLPNSTRKNAISFATATQYVFSIYARAGTTDKFSLRAYCAGTTTVDGVATFTLGTETATAQSDADSAGIEALGGGLYRCWVVFTTDASTTGVNLRIGGPNGLSVTTGETIDVALPVLEAGGFPTEPIGTKDAITSVTRALGDMSLGLGLTSGEWRNVPLVGGGYLEPALGFSIYYDGPARIDTGEARVLFELWEANSDRMALEITGFNVVRFNFREGSNHNRSTGESISGDPTGPLKLALSYDGSTTARMSVNGSAAHGGSGFTFVDATKLQIGAQASHSSVSNAEHGRLVLFQGVLTDAQLEALSS